MDDKDRTEEHKSINNNIEARLKELRDADPDDGEAYFDRASCAIVECLSVMETQQRHITPQLFENTFAAGQASLDLCGEEVVRLLGLPAPTNMAARAANFVPFAIDPLNEDEILDAYFKRNHAKRQHANRKRRFRHTLNEVMRPALPEDTDGKREVYPIGILKLVSECMKSLKDEKAGEELDEQDSSWRDELLDHASLAMVGLARSLSKAFEGRQVMIWGEVVCGTGGAVAHD